MKLARKEGVITCQSIKGAGAGYAERHLSANDYYEEGGKITGEWFGRGAEMLGLAPGSPVTSEAFGSLGDNRHPTTGDKLTPRDVAGRKSWTDITLSCPKAVSVLALVGGDARVLEAWKESARMAFGELESFASMRDRQDRATEHRHESRPTGNIAVPLFFHDSSRELDPQLHVHGPVANATWDTATGSWRALAARDMMMASGYVRRAFYSDLARRLEGMGYEIYSRTDSGFQIRGVEHLEERFSGRTAEVDRLAAAWEAEHGRSPSAKERAILVRDSREDKLKEITTPEVRAAQLARLSNDEKRKLADLTAAAASVSTKASPSPAPLGSDDLDKLLDAGIEHVTERSSVGRTWDALAAAVDALPPGVDLDPAALRARLDARTSGKEADLHLRDGFRFTTTAVLAEEKRCVDLALGGRGAFSDSLADLEKLARQQETAERPLLPEQLEAARTLAASRDGTTVLVGDAGTGKTTLLQALQAASGHQWTALAPTTGAASELQKNGFASALTMQAFLKDHKKQAAAAGGVVLVDEAGLIGAADLRALEEAAKREKFRLVLVGDAKQHSSVTRGDALRGVLDASADRTAKLGEPGLTVARLSRVLRQEEKTDREISETLAAGDFAGGVERQEAAGFITEEANEKKLIADAAAYLVQRRRELAAPGQGKKPGVVVGVTPRWEDAEKLAAAIRPILRAGGELRGEDRKMEVVEPLGLTAAQRRLASSYTPGKSVLTFQAKDESIGARAGENWLVSSIDKDGLFVSRMGTDNPPRLIAWADLGQGVSVGLTKEIALAAGDSILLRAEARQGKKKIAPNGAVKTIKEIAEDGRIVLEGGGVLPANFKHFTHGYSATSHKSQGASEAEAVVVMGQSASEGASRRQWYVSSTRHKIAARYFVADLDAVKSALRRSDDRELAGEMVQRKQANMVCETPPLVEPAAGAAPVISVAPSVTVAAPASVQAPPRASSPFRSSSAAASSPERVESKSVGFSASGPMAGGPAAEPPKQTPPVERQKTPGVASPFRQKAANHMITYQDIVDFDFSREQWAIVRGDHPQELTPEQREEALQAGRWRMWQDKQNRDAELGRYGQFPTSASEVDRTGYAERAWALMPPEVRDSSAAAWMPVADQDADTSTTERKTMMREPDTELPIVGEAVAAGNSEERRGKGQKTNPSLSAYLLSDEEIAAQSESQGTAYGY